MTCVIIPARGGSKGLPRKNILPLRGRPLIEHTVDYAIRSASIHKVYVSTDCDEIAFVARQAGAEVIKRPLLTATDNASSESALIHALDQLTIREGSEPRRIVFLQATSPFRPPDALEEALYQFDREQADSLFSACRLEGFVWRSDETGLRSFTYDHHNRPRRQDAPEDLVENGSIYIFKPWVLRRLGNRLGGRISVYRMPWRYSFQIDSSEDLALLDALIRIETSENNITLSHTS